MSDRKKRDFAKKTYNDLMAKLNKEHGKKMPRTPKVLPKNSRKWQWHESDITITPPPSNDKIQNHHHLVHMVVHEQHPHQYKKPSAGDDS